jgi:hypothetical protein
MALDDDTPPSDTGGGSGSSPTAPKTTPKSPVEPGRVARNNTNLLKIPVTPLKIGQITTTPDDVSRFRIWVPTDSGGVLTIRPKSGTVDLRKPFDKVIKSAASEIRFEVKAGEFGEYFCICKSKKGTDVDCQFVQISFARDGTKDTNDPLIPWTFWYWPTARGTTYWQRAGEIMAKYGKAFNKDPDDCKKEEQTVHVTEPTPTGNYDWQGHCHLAASASMMFEEPKPVKHNGQSFDTVEMKYIALEYFGNFGRFLSIWELKKGKKKVGKYDVTGYFKPGEPKKRQQFIEGLKSEFVGPKESPDDPKINQQLGDLADTFIKDAGSESAFEKQMNQWFGELAAEFYGALIQYMREKKHPLMANMRGYYSNMGAMEVWNHCLFWYKATYEEKDDDKDMLISCDLRVNLDVEHDPGKPAATVSGGQVMPDEDGSLNYRCLWRIQFDGAGKIAAGNRSEWKWIRNSHNDELYSPTKLQILDKPEKTQFQTTTPLDKGNVFVDLEVVIAGMLKLRNRYT